MPTGSGYYSVRDYQDILRHANKLHIQVIPEFDMPGHARAAIKSMEYRYNNLKEKNITAAAQFLLSELGDQSLYKSIQVINTILVSILQHLAVFLESNSSSIVRASTKIVIVEIQNMFT